jgi:hypothetical protein
MQEYAGGQQSASRMRLLELLEICFLSLESTPLFLVLDGIDECHDGAKLIDDLLSATRNGTRTKILFLSRPFTYSFPDTVQQCRQVLIGNQSVADIRTHFNDELPKLKHKLPEDCNLTKLIDHLVTGANGMFVWAFLMIEYLDGASSLTPSRRVKEIENITSPEHLEDVYDRMMTRIKRRYKADRELARFIMNWLQYSEVTLTIAAMKDAQKPPGVLRCKIPHFRARQGVIRFQGLVICGMCHGSVALLVVHTVVIKFRCADSSFGEGPGFC